MASLKVAPIELEVRQERFALDGVFTISRGSRTHADVIAVTLTEDGFVGHGECLPYARYGESLDGVQADIEALGSEFARGLTREQLQSCLPPGAARNALDCALWDLEAKRSRSPVWALAGLPEPLAVTTAYTLSLGTPAEMQRAASAASERPLLKIKLGGEGDINRLAAVRRGAPQSRLIVDANEGWSAQEYRKLAPQLLELGVALIEQPVPAGEDHSLAGIERPVRLCADESCHDRASLDELVGRYDMINIKLDKTGGLTEALALAGEAQRRGLDVMVGCMLATSLSMAPALLVAQTASVVDLDGPLLLAEDRDPALRYDGSQVFPAEPALWG